MATTTVYAYAEFEPVPTALSDHCATADKTAFFSQHYDLKPTNGLFQNPSKCPFFTVIPVNKEQLCKVCFRERQKDASQDLPLYNPK